MERLAHNKLVFILAVAVGSACVHYRNIERVDALSTDTVEVYRSSTAYSTGAVEQTVVERVEQTRGACDAVVIEKRDFSPSGQLIGRSIEHRSCGVVELEVVEHHDVDAGVGVRTIAVDHDGDGRFDIESARHIVLSPAGRGADLVKTE